MKIEIKKDKAVVNCTQIEIVFDKSISERFKNFAECMHNTFGVKSVEVEIFNSQIPKVTKGECEGMPNMSLLPKVSIITWVICHPKKVSKLN